MTENEATRELKSIKSFMKNHGRTTGCDFLEIEYEALNMAIQALEEIQQYRAIGTVEQLEWCKDASHWKELFKEKLEQYEAIGTVEECRVAVERMKPKKLRQTKDGNLACRCGLVIQIKNKRNCLYYCHSCGQKLDWSE